MNLSRPLSATGFMGNATNRFMSLLSTTTSSAHPLCFLRRLSRPLSLYHRYHSLSFPLKPPLSRLSHFHSSAADSTVRTTSFTHPWPEWSHLLDTLFANNAAYNYYNNDNNNNNEVDSFTVDLPHDFARPAAAYMAFARARPGLLRLLSRRDIQVVVENGTPFLFKNGEDSGRRLRLFLDQGFNNVSDTDKAQTVDLMRFILSYASNHVFSSEQNNLYNREFVESSVRNLLREIAKLCDSASESTSFGAVQNKSPYNYGETPRPFEKSMEMKRGDWICSRCSFMNFARNMKCLECEEARPKRQLTGGEWECPQCDFFNYGRNRVCLRCDCKRPGEVPVGTAKTSFDMRFENGDGANKTDIDSRLAANEEKAQRWFSKISQLDNTADLSSAVSDEDFPEIMPLRKGVNRFVVSTRKTPLERRLANTQYQRNLDKGENSAPRTGTANMSHGAIASQTLDDILGRTSVSESNTAGNISGKNVQTDKPTFITSSASTQNRHPRGSNSNYAPFVPLPADAFAKKPENSEDSVLLSESSTKQAGNKNEDNEQAEKSERWFKRVAELHDVTDLASAISDEDFPEIMPLRKGENRFVVSKKKDRSLISPAYKKGTVMEQANNANNVPFVPFPPDYFAKSDNQERNGTNLDSKSADVSTPTTMAESSPDRGPEKLNIGHSKQLETPQTSVASWNSGSSRDNLIKNKTNSVYDPLSSGNSSLKSVNPSIGSTVRMNDGSSRQEEGFNKTVNSGQQYREQENKQSWTGKSLEGSAVKETDPLDMSEEAKAERWFKRVAQINDISELSQIPDEDFPSIMPMRKGVNRFVVSKRKTPLERRLTSPQYRKNLPIVSSDPVKKNDAS